MAVMTRTVPANIPLESLFGGCSQSRVPLKLAEALDRQEEDRSLPIPPPVAKATSEELIRRTTLDLARIDVAFPIQMDVSDDRRSSSLSEPLSEDENPDLAELGGSSRRKSGRVRRKPDLFSSQSFHSSRPKRKRPSTGSGAEEDASNTDGHEQADDDDDDDIDLSDGEPDEEELKARRRLSKKAASQKKKDSKKPKGKPTAKKQKITNGLSTELALRPVLNGKKSKAPSKPKKARMRQSELDDEHGLYAEVFGRGHTTEAVAAEWLTRYEQHNIGAMCDLINFILRCSGTDLQIDHADIGDVDNVPNRLNELQAEYQTHSLTEYPLVSRAKKFKGFQSGLTSFIEDLVRTIHSASVLYSDPALIENLQVWVTSMSSAGIRPFRHTATIISLTIMTTLCHVAREVSSSVSNTRTQLETEKKKKTANKGRINTFENKIEEGQKKLETIDEILRDSFDTVFVHRYRDVDPKIRQECMSSLALWISLYKQMFFEGQYLRYLGWVLSDTVATTRAVVVQQLQKLFQKKENIPGLRAFTERFRPRIIEMAVRDAESAVRAAAVELLDLIRDAGLLEPDDIDQIGRLIFDTEPRVRKAAGKFFVANIQDVYDTEIENFEEEAYDSFVDDDDENLDLPKRSWIKFKCLVDMLQAYDNQDEQEEQEELVARPSLVGSSMSSRYVLATESIYPHFKEFENWGSLAGYLLYDHSQISDASDDQTNSLKNLYRLNDGQENILLEVLECAVKLHIQMVSKSDTDRKGRKTKQSVQSMEERLEDTAHNLSQIIPRLLNKFGAEPEAASPVLRLEHLVNLDLIQNLQKDVATYSDIMDNINNQFLTHSDRQVLAEATVALLRARTSDELKESMDNKIQELWDDTLDSLRKVVTEKGKRRTDTLAVGALATLSNTAMRISNLANVSDCSSILESIPPPSTKQRKAQAEPAVDLLLYLAERGLREEEGEEVDTLEQEILLNVFNTLLVYFLWKIRSLTEDISSGETLSSYDEEYFEILNNRRESFVAILSAILEQRGSVRKDIKLAATTTLLDLHTAFGTLRHVLPDRNTVLAGQIKELVQEIRPATRTVISRLHDTFQRNFAMKSQKKIDLAEDEVADDQSDAQLHSEDEEDAELSDSNENEDDVKRSMLLAEERLCRLTGKLVLAIVGKVLDASGPAAGRLRRKLLRNKSRLGQNYKETLAYLDSDTKAVVGMSKARPQARNAKANGAGVGKVANARRGAARTAKVKSNERVEDDDDEEDEDEEERRGEEDEANLRARGLVEPGEGLSEGEGEELRQSLTPEEVMGD
ncbi:hypothetical protein FQN57_005065 [Myotisia sp. PD_48]|nr:hypothetical protein FQN57_005065 [Myotisia sp. PD_48]